MNTRYGTPSQIHYCKKCVISNQRPSSSVEFGSSSITPKKTISFNEEGVCDACLYARHKEHGINWDARERELIQLLDKHRRKDGRYDVIVPGSGGKDSAFTAHILKYKYNMNPLTVTWAPHMYTDIGWRNFQNWIAVGGLDNVLFTPNGRLHRYLTREAFLNMLHPFQPFILGQRQIGPKFGIKYEVPLIMYGENQAEYGNSISENKTPTMDQSFFSSRGSHDLFLGGRKIRELIAETDFKLGDFEPYLPIDDSLVGAHAISVHYLGYYLKWDPQECFYYAVENTGFLPNQERTEGSYSKYSSIDDKIDPFHYYTTLIKFGIGRATYDACQEIRNGKIDRDEAVSLVKLYDDEFPKKYFKDFLSYISITEDEFFDTVEKFRAQHIWEKVGNQWALRNPVWGE